jgi:RHS repeat-associated protein
VNLPRTSLQFLSAVCLFTIVASSAVAQISQVSSATSTPSPSSGHDYIKMLNETVNPALGSVSVRIEIPLPKGRGLTLPFSIAYDSNGVWHLDGFSAGEAGGASWYSNTTFMSQGGWSYSVPLLSAGAFSTPYPNGGGACGFVSDFVFYDPSGGRHSLGLSSTDGQIGCPYSPVNAAGDDSFTAYTTGQNRALPMPTYVAAADGTTFYFSMSRTHEGYSPIMTSLADSVEDTNGNRITLTDYMTSTSDIGPNRGVFTYTDTLNRTVLSSSGFGSSGNTITVAGLSGNYTVTWGTTSSNYGVGPVEIGIGSCIPPTGVSGNLSVITGITLPNNKSYQFFYDPTYGLLNKIIYPTGAYVRYVWGLNPQSDVGTYPDGGQGFCEYRYGTPAIMHRYVSVDGVHEVQQQDFSYSTAWPSGSGSWNTKQTTMTTSDLVLGKSFQTLYTYVPDGCAGPPPPNIQSHLSSGCPAEQTVVYKDWNGSTLQTVTKSWINGNMMATEQVTLPTGQTSKTIYIYANNNTFNLVTEKDEYDYGQGAPGALLRKTVINYASFPTTPIYPYDASILDKPSSVLVYDGANTSTPISETDYAYDQSALSPVSTVGHDDTNYGTSYLNRGNATTVTQKCFPGCADLITKYTYDQTGQMVSMIDPAGNAAGGNAAQHTTTYSYADDPPGNTNAYLTKITHPQTNGVNHIESFSYNYATGQLTASKDQNQQATSYTYNDSLGRLTEVDYSDGGQFTYDYHADALPLTVTKTALATPDPSIVTSTVYDGLGRVSQTRIETDPDGIDFTDYTYGGLGQMLTESNPHRSTTASTDGTTQYQYDALGRLTTILRQDNVHQPNDDVLPDTNAVIYTYSGNCVTIRDEDRNLTEKCFDSFGHISSVIEPDPYWGQLTWGATSTLSYTYDALGNLRTVHDPGDGTQPARDRSFTYDSLSRLVSTSNPESGTINYAYDSAGDCPAPNSFVGDLVKRLDARGVRTCYQYDALHRMTAKNYSTTTPATASISYFYDQTSYNGLTITYGVGRRTGMSDAATGQTAWSYDRMGRVATKQQNITAVPSAMNKSTIYQYNLAGAVHALTYPSTRVLNYTYDAAGRATSVVGSTGNIYLNYVTNAHYSPGGILINATHGSGITETNTFNSRLQPQELHTSSGTQPTLTDFVLLYDHCNGCNNGNIGAIQTRVGSTRNPGNNRDRFFNHDRRNRLIETGTPSSASTPWTTDYTYDAWGNLLQKTTTGPGTPDGDPNVGPLTIDSHNRVNGGSYTYDASGNLTFDGQDALNFDGENQVHPASGLEYYYDGDGHRVAKSDGSRYWYDDAGRVLTTADDSNTPKRDYIYFNGQKIAWLSLGSGDPHYYLNDHLGSPRVIVNGDGSFISWEADYFPFGNQNVVSNADGLDVFYLFTGYELDYETGNYYAGAREQSPTLGRFFSPDEPLVDQDPSDPKSWNLYSYARNNPLSFTDPSGHACVQAANGTWADDNNGGESCSEVEQADKEAQQNPSVSNSTFVTAPEPTPEELARADAGPMEGESLLVGYVGGKVAGKIVGSLFNRVAGWFGRGAAEGAGTVVGEASAQTAGQLAVRSGGVIERIFQTSAGPVQVFAKVEAEGSTAVIKELAIFPAESNTALRVGFAQTRQGIKLVLKELKEAGFTDFRMEPQYRLGGANKGGYTGTLTGKL